MLLLPFGIALLVIAPDAGSLVGPRGIQPEVNFRIRGQGVRKPVLDIAEDTLTMSVLIRAEHLLAQQFRFSVVFLGELGDCLGIVEFDPVRRG